MAALSAVPDFRCQTPGCSVVSTWSETECRVRGWLLWDGATVGGTEVHHQFCPRHSGRVDIEDVPFDAGFDAECETCGETASDDWANDDWGGTEKQAREWQRRHHCGPDVHLIRPSVEAPPPGQSRVDLTG